MTKIGATFSLSILYIFSYLLFTSTASAAETEVIVACYYHKDNTSKLTYLYLTNEVGVKTGYTAQYDSNWKAYMLPHAQYKEAKLGCKQLLNKQGSTLVKLMAVSESTLRLSGGLLGTHYNLLDSDPDLSGEELKEAKRIFASLNDFESFEHDLDWNSDAETRIYVEMINSINDPNTDKMQFISHNAQVDIPRSNIKILINNYLTYEQKNKISTHVIDNITSIYNDKNEFKYSLDVFNVIEEATIIKQPDILKRRKNIGQALHSRMQSYEFPAQLYLSNFFNDPNKSDLVFSIGNLSGERISITIKINNNQLILINEMTYEIAVIIGGDAVPIGLVDSQRTVTLDMTTGKFSKEIMVLSKRR